MKSIWISYHSEIGFLAKQIKEFVIIKDIKDIEAIMKGFYERNRLAIATIHN